MEVTPCAGLRRRFRLRPMLFLLLLAAFPATLQAAADYETLSRQGAESFRAGQYREAVTAFEQALDLRPQEDEARRNLANAWAGLGGQFMSQGNLLEARRAAEKAVIVRDDMPELHLLLATILIRQAEYTYARLEVGKVIRLDPGNVKARELSGDLYYQDGNIDQAIKEWELALPGNEGHGLRMKLDRAKKESEAEASFGREVSRHFVLLHDGPVPRPVLRTILRMLEEIYDKLSDELMHDPPSEIPIILYSQVQFRELTWSPPWSGGIFDGKIRVPVGGIEDDMAAAQLRSTLAHEMAHAFIRSMAPQGLPLWFQEGFASRVQGADIDAVKAYMRGNTPPYRTLDAVDGGLRGMGGAVDAAYAASFVAVDLLVAQRGFRPVRRIIEEVGAGKPFWDEVRDELSLSREEVEVKWLQAIGH